MATPYVHESAVKRELFLWAAQNIIFKATIACGFVGVCSMLFESKLWFWLYSIPWLIFFIVTTINTLDDVFRHNYKITDGARFD